MAPSTTKTSSNTNASTNATPPPLMNLPAALLAQVFEHLQPAELIRTLTLTTKHPAFHRFVEGPGPSEAALWTRLLRQRLASFTPARAWFGLRSDDLSWMKPMNKEYPRHARQAEDRLASALEAAGVPEAQWVWEEEGISHVNARRLFFLPASIPAGKTTADFLACLKAFSCERCHERGTATKQCCGCAQLLCSTCCGRACELQDDCPFALCRSCAMGHVASVLARQDGLCTAPSVIVPSCSVCPRLFGCEVHVEMGYIVCPGCCDIRCPADRLVPPGMISMCSCGAYGCTRPGCRPPGQYFRMCETYFLQTCNRCEENAGGRCQDCGGELTWKDIDEDWEEEEEEEGSGDSNSDDDSEDED